MKLVTINNVSPISIQWGKYLSLKGRCQLKAMIHTFNLFRIIPTTVQIAVNFISFKFLSLTPIV